MVKEQEKKEDLSSEIKSQAIDYNPNAPKIGELDEKAKKEIDKTKEKLEDFKNQVIKKYDFVLSMGIIPPQAADRFDEELALTEEEKKEKPMHLSIIIPEDNFKQINEVRNEIIKLAKEIKPKLWINVLTPVDLWNYALDSKWDIVEAIGMSYPVFDKGLLGALRVAQIHKSLCLRKFEKYIYSYCIGGSLVRGEAKESSDVDVFVVIDGTDVKRMARVELKEKLRSIIYQYIAEATELAGVKNLLNVQVYLLTEFWEDVKDASPVIFTFIRDGIPLYDRGGFLPWKLLLKMGKIKPSPEAIDRFLNMGDKTKEIVKNRLLDIVLGDIYWNVLTPTQALLMLYGIPPTNTYETVKEFKRIFVDAEKIIEKKYLDILENIAITYYKGYEHGKIKEVSGAEIDRLMKDTEDYTKRLKELAVEIEKRAQEKTLKETYDNVFKLLKSCFGSGTEEELLEKFEKEMIKKGRAEPSHIRVLKELIDTKKKYNSKKKPTKYEIEDVRKNVSSVINRLIEYNQRCEISELAKMKVKIFYQDKQGKNKHAEIYLTNPIVVVSENLILKSKNGKIEQSNQQEMDSLLFAYKNKPSILKSEDMKALKEYFGDFDLAA